MPSTVVVITSGIDRPPAEYVCVTDGLGGIGAVSLSAGIVRPDSVVFSEGRPEDATDEDGVDRTDEPDVDP